MGKISEVLYGTCEDYTQDDAVNFYFYSNINGLNKNVDDEFAKYYENEVRVKNNTLGNLIKGDGVKPSSIASAIMATSSIKKKPVVFVEV